MVPSLAPRMAASLPFSIMAASGLHMVITEYQFSAAADLEISIGSHIQVSIEIIWSMGARCLLVFRLSVRDGNGI